MLHCLGVKIYDIDHLLMFGKIKMQNMTKNYSINVYFLKIRT